MSEAMRLGQAAIQNKDIPEAIHWFGVAVKENPKDPQMLACLGQALCWQGDKKQGLQYLHQAGQILCKRARKSRDVKLLVDLADQLQHWDDYPGSAELCKQAIQINPQFVRAYQLLALAHSRLNQKKPALLAAKQALKLAPDSAMLAILVATLEMADGQPESTRARLEKVLQNPILKPEEKFRAHKELARALDKLKAFDQVFAHLHAAGEVSSLLPEVQKVDANLVPSMLKAYQQEFDAELLQRWKDKTFPTDQPPPIFVLGFMRTGTTLTQEVLGAHKDIFVADETDLVASTLHELKRLYPTTASVPDMLRKLDWDKLLHLRAFYWQRARALYGNNLPKKLFLDKTTMNSIDIGFINCIFPDAKLVFLLRDPRDVCLSCIMQTMIPTPSTVHLLKWESTARFYAQVMAWWATIKPKLSMSFIEFRYEDAVFDFENAFRGIFDFLGLAWDPKVVDFHKNAVGKVIASPSFSQVAQPLYSSSVGRWKHYASEYAPISDTLQPFIDAYGYQ